MGLKFRRQSPMGSYIVDFICIEKKLIIEIDEGQHNEHEQQNYDNRRTEFLKSMDYNVLRFWNNALSNQFDAVMEQIYMQVTHIIEPHPHPPYGHLLPEGNEMDSTTL